MSKGLSLHFDEASRPLRINSLFSEVELINVPKTQPRVLNIAEIFKKIDKERAKTGNTNLYGTTYNEWLKENERTKK